MANSDSLVADPSTEIIFEISEDEVDGGYTASALGYGIHTQGEGWNGLKAMVRDEEIRVDILALEKETEGLLGEILGVGEQPD